jgi:hypothetical protein
MAKSAKDVKKILGEHLYKQLRHFKKSLKKNEYSPEEAMGKVKDSVKQEIAKFQKYLMTLKKAEDSKGSEESSKVKKEELLDIGHEIKDDNEASADKHPQAQEIKGSIGNSKGLDEVKAPMGKGEFGLPGQPDTLPQMAHKLNKNVFNILGSSKKPLVKENDIINNTFKSEDKGSFKAQAQQHGLMVGSKASLVGGPGVTPASKPMPTPQQHAKRAASHQAALGGEFTPKGPINSGLELARSEPKDVPDSEITKGTQINDLKNHAYEQELYDLRHPKSVLPGDKLPADANAKGTGSGGQIVKGKLGKGETCDKPKFDFKKAFDELDKGDSWGFVNKAVAPGVMGNPGGTGNVGAPKTDLSLAASEVQKDEQGMVPPVKARISPTLVPLPKIKNPVHLQEANRNFGTTAPQENTVSGASKHVAGTMPDLNLPKTAISAPKPMLPGVQKAGGIPNNSPLKKLSAKTLEVKNTKMPAQQQSVKLPGVK